MGKHITFQKRISGLARVAWEKRDVECEDYEVRPPGSEGITPSGTKFITYCWSIRTYNPNSGWHELRPGTLKELP